MEWNTMSPSKHVKFFFFTFFFLDSPLINIKMIKIFVTCQLPIISVGRKWFTGQAHLPKENPKAQAEEDYGPSSTKQPSGTAEGISVLGRPTVLPEGRVKTV